MEIQNVKQFKDLKLYDDVYCILDCAVDYLSAKCLVVSREEALCRDENNKCYVKILTPSKETFEFKVDKNKSTHEYNGHFIATTTQELRNHIKEYIKKTVEKCNELDKVLEKLD